MRIIKPNGDIIELNTAEYRELFMQPQKTIIITPEAAEELKKAKAEFEEHLKEHPVKVEPLITDFEKLNEESDPIPGENEPSQEAEIAPQSEEKPAVDKLPEAPKEAQEKPIFKLADEPKKEDPKPLQPSDLLEPEPSEGGKDKKKLDDGKICALRRAGWTWDKIADEMHCSAQTALNHYNAYIRKMGKE